MDYFVKSGNALTTRTGCLAVAVFERRKLGPRAQALDTASGGAIKRILARGDFDGKAGRSLVIPGLDGVNAERVLLLGCGPQKGFDEAGFRKLVATALSAIGATGSKDASLCLDELPLAGRDNAWKVRQAVTAASAAVYRFEELRSKAEAASPLKKLSFLFESAAGLAAVKTALAQGRAIASGVDAAKDLGNRPGNVCTPTHFAEQAQALAKRHKGLKCKVLEEADMEALGMGALLSVSRGSRQPAKLILLEYKRGKKGAKPVALVGKGLTFDAGGISLKPAAKMEEMKFDMCGGAAVIGALTAAAEMELPLNIIGVIPSSENLPDGDANKPGDVVTSMAGITIEVINTDAEGRLILCDALTYVQQEYEPELIVDMATLTGACVVALGAHATGLFSNNDALAKALLSAGEDAGDRAWQLPLWEDYQAQLKSPVADVSNVGNPPGGGAITAASFLHRFTRKATWAHLDIAGSAWDGKKTSTGRPVPLLVQFLMSKAGI